MVSFNFSAQKRAVTINDYQSLIETMPGKFGAPAKVSITEQNNKIIIQILSYDTNGALTSNVSNTLAQNIATYLSNYRMINDYIQVEAAQVIDLEFEYSIVFDSTQNQGQVITQVIDQTQTFMSPQIRTLGQNVNISNLRSIIQDIPGVVSVADIKVFNKVGGQYSSSETSQRYSNDVTKQIQLIDETIYAQPNQIYQVRYPNKDIKVRIKNLKTVDFS
jgi:hypothetical protein